MGKGKRRRQVDPNYGKKSLKIIFRDLIVGGVFLRQTELQLPGQHCGGAIPL
jgi:hypothetical protein